MLKNLLIRWNKISLVKQIIIGLIVGIILALAFPKQLSGITVLGDLFVGSRRYWCYFWLCLPYLSIGPDKRPI